jgi:dienelactone hydrolase
MRRNHPLKGQQLMLALAAVILAFPVAMAQPAACGPFPGCLYAPPATYGIDLATAVVTYTDAAGLERDVPIAIRRPTGKAGPLPVVIWVHGGGEGHSNPVTSMEEWSTATAEAGYLSIAGAHDLREGKSRDQLCMALGIPLTGCVEFQPLDWDRPKDVSAIIDELVKLNAQGPWRGQIDIDRIAVGGHSAGSAATMTVAGARRLRLDQSFLWNLTDRRPIVFLGFSPQGPGDIGFFETDFQQTQTSWDPITRPVLIGTGDGDAHCDGPARDLCKETPMLRRIAFDRMRPGDKYMMYIKDSDTFHNIFALNTGACAEKNVSQADCMAFASWLKSSALAFLDFYLEGRLAAQTWLQNPYLKMASSGVTEIERR